MSTNAPVASAAPKARGFAAKDPVLHLLLWLPCMGKMVCVPE